MYSRQRKENAMLSPTSQVQAQYSAMDIAKYFIWKSSQEKKPITNKKIQKLVYYSQAWNLVLHNEPLFNEELEAWIHGPVVRSLYDAFSKFGTDDIAAGMKIKESEFKDFSSASKDILDQVWHVYGKYTANDLEVFTHSEDPWQKAREGLEPYEASTNVISLDSMLHFYEQKK
jgi:uncharacterized phage-associated protein